MCTLFSIMLALAFVLIIVVILGGTMMILNAVLEDCFGLDIRDLIERVHHKIRKGGDSHELEK